MMSANHPMNRFVAFVREARHALLIQVHTPLYAELLDACMGQVEKGVAVELLLSEENQTWLDENPFLFNKCVLLVKKGGSLFLTASATKTNACQCIADFAHIQDVISTDTMPCVSENKLTEVQARVKEFNRIKAESKPYLVEPGDIQIRLTVSEQVVLKGDMVEVGWEVDSADQIVLQGMGVVQPYGTQKIPMQQSTIIKLGAYNARQSQLRAVQIWVSEAVHISYDIGFLGKQSQAYYSLVQAENYPHIYGVATGNTIRFTWKVQDANAVTVYPFGSQAHQGEQVFTPTESMTIEVQATVQDRILTRKITLLVFPLPVFADKFIPPMTSSAYHPLFTISEQTQQELRTHAQKTLHEAEQRYIQLCATVSKQAMDIQSKSFNLSRINALIWGFLRKKQAQKPGIVRILESIQDYYHTPKHG